MADASVQVIVGEAGTGHQPRGLADNLGVITVGVSVDAVEHLAITGF